VANLDRLGWWCRVSVVLLPFPLFTQRDGAGNMLVDPRPFGLLDLLRFGGVLHVVEPGTNNGLRVGQVGEQEPHHRPTQTLADELAGRVVTFGQVVELLLYGGGGGVCSFSSGPGFDDLVARAGRISGSKDRVR